MPRCTTWGQWELLLKMLNPFSGLGGNVQTSLDNEISMSLRANMHNCRTYRDHPLRGDLKNGVNKVFLYNCVSH